MSRIILWSRSLSRVELDQRSREARLRLEQLERLLVPHVTVRRYRRRRLLFFGGRQISARAARASGRKAAERSAAFPHADTGFQRRLHWGLIPVFGVPGRQ
jgi:hypothetical protein